MTTNRVPQPGEPGYLEPNSGLLTVGQASQSPTVAGYTPSQAQATPASASTYDPSKFLVDDKQTVQGQVEKIVDSDSKLMQQARVRANQDAQAKGLLSSSLAVEAGQNAVIGQALPIASQDAATYNRAMTDTANAENTAKQFNAGSLTDVSKSNAGLLTQTALANAESANLAKRSATGDYNQAALSYADNLVKTALGNLDVQSRQLLQANANAQQMFQEVVKNIAGIAVDATLSQDAKEEATQSQLNLLREGLATTAGIASTVPAAIANLNLSRYFNPVAA